ncbi:MAG: D-glycero-beta-D-manno-heptose-7-phosphate kinase [Alphaproteobacteria bacterium]
MSLKKTLKNEINRIKSAKVLCIGDVMLDKFIYGEVERISPEAPVPILKINKEEYMLGGAGNVIRNLAALGAEAFFIGVVGNDDNGNIIRDMIFSYSGSKKAHIFNFASKTTTKKRFVTNSQQLLRVDDENNLELSLEQKKEFFACIEETLKEIDTVVISDYGKGLLSVDVLKEIISLSNKHQKKVFVDPKGRNFSIYQGAFMVTPNKKELSEATDIITKGNDNILLAANKIISESGIENVLVTRSDEGMTLVERCGEVEHFAALAKEVFDVSGAGDTVVAVMAACLGAGTSLSDATSIANIAGSVVVGKKGTAVAYPEELIKAINESHNIQNNTDKIVGLNSAVDLVASWKDKGLKVGFTNGCFDLLHPGHISLIEQSKKTCDKLVIGLNSDSSVKRLKGESRPIQDEQARSLVLSSLTSVDLVVIFDEDTPLNLISALKPDILVKGADYTIATVVGADVVMGYGGKVVLANLEDGFSTTRTIKKINS